MKYHDSRAHASDPGYLRLSERMLFEIQPELAPLPGWKAALSGFWPRWARSEAAHASWRELIAEHLRYGDRRAALVVDVGALVAAYTDELDCVVLLRFDPGVAARHGWRPGQRLLTVNTYFRLEDGTAGDLLPGPDQIGRYGNFYPLIGDLLTEDAARLAQRKAAIPETEWARTLRLTREAVDRGALPRDGRPLLARRPAK